jgi:hypothetical protein
MRNASEAQRNAPSPPWNRVFDIFWRLGMSLQRTGGAAKLRPNALFTGVVAGLSYREEYRSKAPATPPDPFFRIEIRNLDNEKHQELENQRNSVGLSGLIRKQDN